MNFIKTRFLTLSQIPSYVYLWVATLIFAASSSITRKLTEIGAQHLVDGRNPISLCNVLFVGNLCALIVMMFIFSKQWHRRTLKKFTKKDWISLTIIAILSGALGPALIFAALDNTTVTNVVLITRLEPPITLALSVFLLKTKVNRSTVAGSLIAFIGIAITALLGNSEPSMAGFIGKGELQAAIGAIILAIATVISKLRLQQVPLGFFSSFRTAVGTVIFFLLANILYGSEHFIDALSPFLWLWMLIYGAIIVVAGQLCWFAGLKNATSSEITLSSSFNPIAAIIMAYLILEEVPTTAQYIGSSIIIAGIILSAIGSLRQTKPMPMNLGKYMEMTSGFKGV